MKIILQLLALSWGFLTLQGNTQSQPDNFQDDLVTFTENILNISEVMVNDVTPPATASRYYAYSILGAYEVAWMSGKQMPEMNSKFRTNPGIKQVPLPNGFDFAFSANYAMLEIGRRMLPQGQALTEYQNNMVETWKSKKHFSIDAIESNVAFANKVAEQVVKYAQSDGYNKLSTYPRYAPKRIEGYWFPTPPAFLAAADAHWSKIRTFFLDSANQFMPGKPTPFSKDSSSAFYDLAFEVYTAGNNLTSDQKIIANFWDCNPFSLEYSGHMEIGIKKISPGGHWLGITGIVCRDANVSLERAILIHTCVALALHDAFISCWYQKFYHERVRPETYINRYIDARWRPILQTPPFPDYTSGHSTISPVAAIVLNYFLGDHFSFLDTTEVIYGLPERRFESFNKAAKEASQSRVYGGIHFRDACEEGHKLGTSLGDYLVDYMFKGSSR